MSDRVTVIGGGVLGLCVADHAAARGFRVTVLERETEDHASCSFGNAGMIVPSHIVPLAAPGVVGQALRWMRDPASPFHVTPRLDRAFLRWSWLFARHATAAHVAAAAPVLRDLQRASRALYADLAGDTGNAIALEQRGLLLLCRTQAGLDAAVHDAELARGLGITAEVLDAPGVAARETATPITCAGGVYFPRDASLTPGALMAALRARVAARGVQVRYETEVLGWRMEGDRVRAVRTAARDDIEAGQVVLAGGVWSRGLVRELALELPLEAGKGYSLTLDDPPARPSLCALLAEAHVAVTPMGAAVRVGGTMELAGLDRRINPVRVRGILDAVERYYPTLPAAAFARVTPWAGLRPCSPDGLPYIGRTRRARNLLLATGHAMMGVSLAPITGQLVAEVLAGTAPSIDLAPLSPDRFSH